MACQYYKHLSGEGVNIKFDAKLISFTANVLFKKSLFFHKIRINRNKVNKNTNVSDHKRSLDIVCPQMRVIVLEKLQDFRDDIAKRPEQTSHSIFELKKNKSLYRLYFVF